MTDIRQLWGLPNWQDPSSYGDTRHWTVNRWRWEFTRRRPDYRQAFDDAAQASLSRAQALYSEKPAGRILSIDEPGFCADERWPPKFGLSALPNPRISNQPQHVLSFLPLHPSEIYVGEGPEWPNDNDATAIVHVPKGRLAVVLDLARPMSAQLDELKASLEATQEIEVGKPVTRRSHPTKWLTYLRVLDGRESGASWSDLTAALGKAMRSNLSHEPQAAAQVHKAAQTLMFNWPD